MRKKFTSNLLIIITVLLTGFFSGCMQQDPITGRSHLNLVGADSLNKMSFQQYNEIIEKNGLSTDPVKTAMVRKVGYSIKDAVEDYCRQVGVEDRLKNFEWEFSLIENKQQNAFCMPGGKVGIYTGILELTENEEGLAVVMAHEIAHAIAEHSRERMSRAMLVSFGGAALGQAMKINGNKSAAVFMGLYGLSANMGFILPHSRVQEYEADKLGLRFMAMAGYDPKAAVSLWERMSSQNKRKPPEFLSTHPTDKKRIEQIKKLLPEAIEIYNKARASGGRKIVYYPEEKKTEVEKTEDKKIIHHSEPEEKLSDLEKARRENRELREKLGIAK